MDAARQLGDAPPGGAVREELPDMTSVRGRRSRRYCGWKASLFRSAGCARWSMWGSTWWRGDPLHHRSQRCRQDVDGQRGERPVPADLRAHLLQGSGSHRPQAPGRGRARHHAHVPEPGAVPRPDGDREHPRRPPSAHALGPARRRHSLGRGATGGAGASPQGRGDHRVSGPPGCPGPRGRHAPLRLAETGRAGSVSRRGAGAPDPGRAHGRHEPPGEGGHGAHRRRRQRGSRHHHPPDRART